MQTENIFRFESYIWKIRICSDSRSYGNYIAAAIYFEGTEQLPDMLPKKKLCSFRLEEREDTVYLEAIQIPPGVLKSFPDVYSGRMDYVVNMIFAWIKKLGWKYTKTVVLDHSHGFGDYGVSYRMMKFYKGENPIYYRYGFTKGRLDPELRDRAINPPEKRCPKIKISDLLKFSTFTDKEKEKLKENENLKECVISEGSSLISELDNIVGILKEKFREKTFGETVVELEHDQKSLFWFFILIYCVTCYTDKHLGKDSDLGFLSDLIHFPLYTGTSFPEPKGEIEILS